jgi:curved DNA-binding protein
MIDPYSVLGVGKNSSDSDIKAAYRKLAKEHHPDKGGSHEKFAEINAAYDSIKDADARAKLAEEQSFQRYQSNRPQQDPFANFNDLFAQHFGGQNPFRDNTINFRTGPRNQDINITYSVDLEDVFNCAKKNLNINLPNGTQRAVTIEIPKGVTHGTQIRYQGFGDNTYQGKPGNLLVTFQLKSHPKFRVEEYNVILPLQLSLKEALFGTEKVVETLDKRQLKLHIKSGTQIGTRLRIPEGGLPQPNKPNGNLYIEVSVIIPNLTEEDLDKTVRDVFK